MGGLWGREKWLVNAVLKKFSRGCWEELRYEELAELRARRCQSSFSFNSARLERSKRSSMTVDKQCRHLKPMTFPAGNKHNQLTVKSSHCNRLYYQIFRALRRWKSGWKEQKSQVLLLL